MQPTTRILIAKLAEVNWFIVTIVSLLAGVGIIMMVSAGGGDFSPWAMHQLVRFGVGMLAMMCVAMIPIRVLLDFSYPVYFLGVAVLVVVEVMGHVGMGAQRWIKLGGVTLQPSEFMKLALIMALARYFHNTHPEDIRRPAFLIAPLILIVVPVLLILKQPNLGTAIITALVGGILCFLAGVRWRYFIGLLVLAAASAPVAWQFLHDYQKKRVLTFLDPEQDPLGAGYNLLQSIIAIGSGGLLGKGYLQGSQNQLNFLPEKHTDFIFTAL
ncbi:MAG: FtsW/RodA/SpoVE family cell cycle protein, partial [Alphaproteobacteria bacterium]